MVPTGVVSQISDGVRLIFFSNVHAVANTSQQIQAPTNGTMVYPTPSVSVQAQTGAAAPPVQIGSGLGLAAAIFGVVML